MNWSNSSRKGPSRQFRSSAEDGLEVSLPIRTHTAAALTQRRANLGAGEGVVPPSDRSTCMRPRQEESPQVCPSPHDMLRGLEIQSATRSNLLVLWESYSDKNADSANQGKWRRSQRSCYLS